MITIESIVRRILDENKAARDEAEKLTSRAVSAISRNAPDEFSDIIIDASGADRESSGQPVEAGNPDGASGTPITTVAPAAIGAESTG